MIDNGATVDEARRAAFEALSARGGTIRTEQVRVEMGDSHDDPAVRARHMGEALYARINPQHQLSEPARRYAYATCAEMARELLTLRGHSVNPFSGSLSLVVEPRLSSATRWYVSADPAEIDGLEYAYLAGGEGPQVETKAGWDVDGVEIRVILDFGAGFIDWRGWYANAGA